MNRVEFMNQLEALLTDISESERAEAIQYYNDYFDDAGFENEPSVIEALGSPEQVARIIKDDLDLKNDQNQDDQNNFQQNQNGQEQYDQSQYNQGQYNQGQFNQGQFQQGQYQQAPNGAYGSNAYQAPPRQRSGGQTALIICLLVFTCPLWIGLLASAFGIAISILAALFGIMIGFGGAGIAVLIAGVCVFGVSIVKMFVSPAGGIFLMGISVLMIGIALLLLIAAYGITFRLLPAIVRGTVYLCRLPFGRRGGRAA